MTRKLLALRGLPASGKSTYARELLASLPAGEAVRVNNDELTLMLFGSAYVRSTLTAGLLADLREQVIKQSFNRGVRLVIVDNTNLTANALTVLRSLAIDCGAVFELDETFMSVSVETCLERNALRSQPVPESVILQMAETAGLVQN